MSQRTLAKRSVKEEPKQKKPQSRLRYWAKEALTTGAVLLIVALVLAGGITETTKGLIAGCVAVAGAIYLTAIPVAEESNSRRIALGLYAFSAVWALSAILPFWGLLRPGAPVARATLAKEGDERSVGKLASGRYTLVARAPREAIAGLTEYSVSVAWPGGEEHSAGRFDRADFRTRAGRRGRGTAASIHTTDRHEIAVAGGGPTKVRLDMLKGGLGAASMTVELFRETVPHWLWLVLGALVVIGAAALDALFADRKRRSTLTVGAVFTVMFVEVARQNNLSPSRAVWPLLGAAIVAFIVAAIGGYLLNTVARSLAGHLRRARPAV